MFIRGVRKSLSIAKNHPKPSPRILLGDFLKGGGGKGRGGMYMGKTGTIWQFFRALFPSTSRTLSPNALFTRIRHTRKHPESAIFRAFPASIWKHSPPKCLFSRQTLNCQIVPVLPSYRGGIPHPGERYNVCPQWCRDTRTVTRVRHHLLC